jgi:DNA-binding NarL/FixJ family response regulator
MKVQSLIIIESDDAKRRSLEQFFISSGSFSGCSGFDSLVPLLKSDVFTDTNLVLISLNGNDEQQADDIYILKRAHKNLQILLLSNQLNSQEVLRLISSGVSGILDKAASFTKIKESLHIIQLGGCVIAPTVARKVFDHLQPPDKVTPHLSKRERDVLEAMLSGLSYQAIGDHLHISINTVRKYIRQLYTTYQVNSKGELMAKYHSS